MQYNPFDLDNIDIPFVGIEMARYDEMWLGIKIKNKNKLPMPTFCLKDKQFCAKEYAGLMTLSKKDKVDKHRFVYKNGIDTKELAKELGIGRTTLETNIKKLQKLNYKVIELENTSNGIVYKLNYGLKNEENNRINKYVTIHHPMLKELACSFNSNAIKLYCLLKYMCKENEFTMLTEHWLCEQIGLTGKSENNQTTVRGLVKTLEKCRFIETKRQQVFRWDEVRNKQVPNIMKLYRLCSIEEWLTLDRKVEK